MGRLRVRQNIDTVEFFSGGEAGEAVTKSMAFFDLNAVGVEVKKDFKFHDFCTAEGFTFALSMVFRLVDGGLCFLAPVCSNWIWLVRSVSGRCSAYPLGFEWVPDVEWSNRMVSRVVLILLICNALGVCWVIEQPLSSVLWLHPRFQNFLRQHRTYRVTLDMFSFGADTAKPTVLYSSHPWIEEIRNDGFYRPAPQKTLATREWCPDKEKYVVTGGGAIKASQHYPIAFGRAVARAYNAHRAEIRATALAKMHASVCTPDIGEDAWEDAHMAEVLEYAQSLDGRGI